MFAWENSQTYTEKSKKGAETPELIAAFFFVFRLMNAENSLLKTREEENAPYERTLVASEFIDWLLQEGEMATREEAEQLGRRLLEHGIIQHGECDPVSDGGNWISGGLSIGAFTL